MRTNIIRYTGYRIRTKPPGEQPYAWRNLQPVAQQLAPMMQAAANEPYFLDDALKAMPPDQLIMHALQDGEIFLCHADDVFVGWCSIRDIKHERSAIYDAWASPQFRGPQGKDAIYKLFYEVVQYAFEEWPKGLGLKKLKADIAVVNTAALVTARNMGFVDVGLSPLDSFHNGTPFDSVLLELLNPKYFGLEVEDIADDIRRREQQAASSSTIRVTTAGTELRDAAGPERDSAAGAIGETGDFEGELPGGVHDDGQEGEDDWTGSDPGESETGQGPAKSRSRRSLRDSLLSATDKPANSRRKNSTSKKRR